MSVKEPHFDTGKEQMLYRQEYIYKWLEENHPAIFARFHEDGGNWLLYMALDKTFSDDFLLIDVIPELSFDSKPILGRAIVMRGVNSFTAPVMCKRIDRRIKQTGNYDGLMLLDSIAKRIKCSKI